MCFVDFETIDWIFHIDGRRSCLFRRLEPAARPGTGLVLLSLGQTGLPLQRILNELSRRPRCDTKQRKSLFADFEFSKITFSKFLRPLLVETADEASGWSERHIIAMVDRCSTLRCMMKLGGFQTFSLRDQLIIPANFFEVTDPLSAEGVPDSDLIGTDARRWVNP
jgi:hypothetical protein